MRSTFRGWLVHWIFPLLWMALLFFLSAQPDLPHAPGPWVDILIKKAGHAFVYGVLAWLYLRALRWQLESRTPLTVRNSHSDGTQMFLRMLSVGLAVAYALGDEYHQTLVPGRNGNLFDVMIDGVGACAAMLLNWWLARRRAEAASAVQ